MPGSVRRRRFRWECAVIVRLAWALQRRLAHGDPLAGRIRVPKVSRAGLALRGIVQAW